MTVMSAYMCIVHCLLLTIIHSVALYRSVLISHASSVLCFNLNL